MRRMPRRATTRRSSDPYKSGLEAKIAKQFEERGLDPRYESVKLRYVRPQSDHFYKPDFQLPNGIFVEAKGFWEPSDRIKHLWIKQCNPDVEIRFVFSSAHKPIRKGSPTSYADWCDNNGFMWAERTIPAEWFNE
jgi:hypothetical protein